MFLLTEELRTDVEQTTPIKDCSKAHGVSPSQYSNHDRGPGWRRSCGWGCAGAAPVRPRPNTHATHGAACVVSHAHDLCARWLGRGALPALCITIPPCTTAAPAGGAHVAGGVRGRLACA